MGDAHAQLEIDLQSVLADAHGPSEVITYRPAAGGSVSRQAVVSLQDAFPTQTDHGDVEVADGAVLLSRDADLGVVLPVREDTLTIRGNLWAVVTVNSLGDGWKLLVRRSTTLAVGTTPFRRGAY